MPGTLTFQWTCFGGRGHALLPVSPALNTRTVSVSLEPGHSPVPVFTTANIATALAFHDATGQP